MSITTEEKNPAVLYHRMLFGYRKKRKIDPNPIIEHYAKKQQETKVEETEEPKIIDRLDEKITRIYGADYVQGLERLQSECKTDSIPHSSFHCYETASNEKTYRPLTLKEIILTRVEDYNKLRDKDGKKRSIEDRKRLFISPLDSCTGIAYKAESSKFKLILCCEDLIMLPKDYDKSLCCKIDYDSICGKGVIELDKKNGRYNQLLTKEESIHHEAWRNIVDYDTYLLREYTSIVLNLLKGSKKGIMGFWIDTTLSNSDYLKPISIKDVDMNPAFPLDRWEMNNQICSAEGNIGFDIFEFSVGSCSGAEGALSLKTHSCFLRLAKND